MLFIIFSLASFNQVLNLTPIPIINRDEIENQNDKSNLKNWDNHYNHFLKKEDKSNLKIRLVLTYTTQSMIINV